MKTKALTILSTALTAALTSSAAAATAPWLENFIHPLKQEQMDSRWHADGGQIHIRFNHDLLRDWSLDVKHSSNQEINIAGLMHHTFNIPSTSSLVLKAPFGRLQSIPQGTLQMQGEWRWQSPEAILSFANLTIAATDKHLNQGELASLAVSNESGLVLFYLDHIHTELDINNGRFHARRMDIRVSPEFAKSLGIKELTDVAIGEAHMENHLTIPPEYDRVKGQPTCPDDRPLWPSEKVHADVALIDMSWQHVRFLGNDDYVFAPNATLKNVGDADVAWYGKFSGDFPPYNNAQHPFLFWAAYREIDGRFEQIGMSDIKHAFFTINTNCTFDCGDNHILYKGCEDIYSVNNNDTGSALGPKAELTAFTGDWEEDGSFFDQDGNGVQDNTSNNSDENRLIIKGADISDDMDDYYFSAWYLIKDDINIFNTMGYRSYDLSPNQQQTAWSFSNASPLVQGPASDAYVAPNTVANDLMSASKRHLEPAEGHLTVAVKVIDLGGGMYRYNYMVENHDYDPRVNQIAIPLNDHLLATDYVWSDIDHDTNNDWSMSHQDNQLVFTQNNDNTMDWGMLFSFSFTTEVPPETGSVTLTGHENGNNPFSVDVVVPLNDLIFRAAFESQID